MKILKVMSEMTARTDMNEFAQKVGSSPANVMEEMRELARDGYLQKVGSGYHITERGKNVLKASALVSEEHKFVFYSGLDNPTGLSADSVEKFLEVALKVDPSVLEFHLYRGDFENWFRAVVGDDAFAGELTTIRDTNLRGEELQKAIAKAIDVRYCL
jgi:DNA-binding Lrp family transcriptional regulator